MLRVVSRMRWLALLDGKSETRICRMNWKENIARWRSLSPEEKLRSRWEAIPLNVARSMAFEGEPVPVEKIRAILAQIEPPALLKPRKAS